VPAYDLVIFDLDGTLIDSVGDIADALNGALAAIGMKPHSDEAVSRMVGSGVTELCRRALGESSAELLASVEKDYRTRYHQQPLRRTGLYLGVKATLAKLSVAKAIATNKPGASARAIVDGLHIAEYFVAVLGEDDVGQRKPDPLIVDILRGKTGVPRHRTLYVGDSLVDADTADAARVDLCLVTYGYADPAQIRARKAAFHVDRFPDLVGVCG